MFTLNPSDIIRIHDDAINPHEIQGQAMNKSVNGILGRVESRIDYGMITTPTELASWLCIAIARGHVFNDANKRTAFKCMMQCLRLNGIELTYKTHEMGDLIISVARGDTDESMLTKKLLEWA